MSSQLFLTWFTLYLSGVFCFGLWMSRGNRTGEDFLLGGRSLPFFLTLGTTVATMVGTGSSMGAVGKAYANGWTGWFYGIGGFFGLLLVAAVFAPVRQYRFMTMAEEISAYVGANRTVRNLLSILIYLACVGWLGAHIIGGSMYLEQILGLPSITAKLIVALGFALYSIVGGYRAVVWTDALQAVVLFIGFVITAGFAYQAIGGWDQLQSVNATIAAKSESTWIHAISLAAATAVGVLGTPSFRQRVYSGKSARAVRKAFATSAVIYLAFGVLPASIGIAAYQANPGIEKVDRVFPFMATEQLPLALGVAVLIAGLSATMSSASSDAVAGVTTLMTDVSIAILGRVPAASKVILFSRISLAFTIALAIAMTLAAKSIVGFITSMIGLFLSGMCVAGFLGRLWPRYNAPGAIASLISASLTAAIINHLHYARPWLEFWANPVIPAVCVSVVAGIVVSLLTPPDSVSFEAAVSLLEEERQSGNTTGLSENAGA
ncbi:MAG TPA: sodium:proline symporter [Planctomycetaceae bacterium]|nr:sodium:proline symporter [Planctomycetaceae bacterium]